MSQATNLNVAPYFDDFDANNGYHRVLFKPGYPVQARELTTLQSILQNQIEKFGQHFFKEGAKVIPGNTGYTQLYYAVELQNTYLGVPVSAYADQLVGTKITGQTSGVTAVVDKVLSSTDSERGNLTLYVNYISSNTQNNSTQQFSDGELLTCNTQITSGLLGNSLITAGQPFASTIAQNATSIGSAFSITNGVYFVRGQFVNVNTETLILDQYSNTPNYRVGLFINEEIVTSYMDESLNDNSQGFNNYSAPGADRLKITVSLFKKSLTDFNDGNFVELATIKDGVIRSQQKTTEYSLVTDELARRTYAESGDYYVTPFDVSLKESLNDNVGNNGLFDAGQFTYSGSTPSQNLAVYQFSPGKAFVRGYECETISPTFLDCPKPRTTKTLENQSLNYNTGPTLKLNRVYGAPKIGIGNTYVLSLRNSRVGTNQRTAPGKEIGVARVYDFRLESGSYDTANANLNQWNISLYDVQTITEITLNEAITLSTPTFIKGKNSGATAFLKDSVTAGVALTVYDKTGDFILNESFIIDGIENTRVATAITSYGFSDIQSVYGIVGSASTFSADTIESVKFNVGIASITPLSAGVSTITSPNKLFSGRSVKVGNLIQYSDPAFTDPVYARVVSTGNTSVSVAGVTTVSGINEAKLPTVALNVTDLKILGTNLETSTDNTLYTRLPKVNISNVDLTNAVLGIRTVFTVNISQNQLTIPVTAGNNETFLPFDEERYALITSNGQTEVLTSDRVQIDSSGTSLTIYNLSTSSDTGATLIATTRKIKPKEKIKRKNRVNYVIVDKSKYEHSGLGATTLNDGLTYGNYPFGTRVQDEIISLNEADIIEVHGIFESTNTSTASAPTVVLSSISGTTATTSDLIIGEKVTGQTSGAVAIVAEKINDTQISFIYKNQKIFKEGETLKFEESQIQAVVQTINSSSFDISSNFTFTNGQEITFYDYGSIRRKPEFQEPTKKLKIYFSNGYYGSNDDGDITTTNSYNTFDYSKEIQSINGIRNTDIIDIRPKTSTYTVSVDARSPLEFYGRTFNSSGNSAKNILASDESILTTFSFYLGRIDRVYLTKEGKFQVKYGVPAEKPEKPVSVDDALEIATINLPAYLYNVSQASIQFLEHKRYRMVDIKQLENRIKNLEYYTALSLLETNTANLFIPDNDGLNRFKSGFFVDNFTSLLAQEDSVLYKNSIDITNKQLRPRHYTNSVDLIFGPITGVDPTEDLAFTPIEGVNVRKSKDIITLDYAEVEWLKQSFATRSESITPFLISFWQGTLELTPASDTWVDTVRLQAKTIQAEGNYAETLSNAVRTLNVDPQTGFAPVVWNAWQTNWTGSSVVTSTSTRTESSSRTFGVGGWINGGTGSAQLFEAQTTSVIQETVTQVVSTGVQSRTGTRTIITEQFDNTSVGDRVVSRNLIPYMRSRNIQFVSKKLKPLTQIYAFFDGVNVTKYCVPKLLEISMISGTFAVGEKVIATVQNTGLNPSLGQDLARISFRVAQSNHKEGPYNAATTTYPNNPYTGQILQSTYSSTSNILNVDTFSLSNQPQGEYSGWVESGMILVGQTSGAQATLTKVRLVSDLSATLIGSFFIPNPNTNIHPKFEAGTKTFTLVNSNSNDQNVATTIAEEGFISSGTLETVQENIISVRNARIQNKQEFEERAISSSSSSSSANVIGQATTTNLIGWYDPLAQSFLVEDNTGVFLTKCDVFFRSKDDMDIPVTFQLRTMQNGFPTQKILPFSEITLDPADVQTSADGSVATTFDFDAPVYLEGGKEYCICLASNSTKYSVYISRIGENDLLTQTFISNQPYLGSLFKSQNASTWEASQWEDLKFTLYRADFLTSGTVEFYNPELTEGNKQIPTLMPNSINLISNKIRVGLGSTVVDAGLTLGNKVIQQGTNATATYVGSAGSATGKLNVINSGIGYTPSSGGLTINNINLVTITGNGKNATANVTVSNGVAIAATVVSGGVGYQVGDVVGISTFGSISVGKNARFSVGLITATNQLILDNVQGEFVVGSAKTVQYINSSGITTTLNAASGGGVFINAIETISDGLHFKVNHQNHGMYSNQNYVTLSNIQSDINPTKLSIAYNSNSTGSISVDSATNFSSFENVGVGTTNPGYLLIGDEVIEYTSVSGNLIGGNISRGASPKNYPAGTPVYKYELGGVSLKRINKTHYLGDVTISNPITFDSYHVKLDMGLSGIGRTSDVGYPKLFINQTKSAGGYNIKATQNMPYEIITPIVQNLTVRGTSLSASLRTVTGSSISGNEIPFIDNGFENITVNSPNYLDSTRIICSKINENARLTSLPGNKSMNLRLQLDTADSKLTPVIDTQRVSTILTSNRVNSVISNYATDSRVNTIDQDPSAFQYISKEINLENGASSIKVLLNAHINQYCDIRALYAISEKPNFNPVFVPFPGYTNLNTRNEVISFENSDGRSDVFVTPTQSLGFESSDIEFKEYSFTIDKLPSFKSYRIKLVLTSTNQVYVPRIKDLRVIALA
ncbi:MAG: DUF4815 domain-containing protein [Proteobacteria bacterium]|nr:DUF4815 domain-containing protein [Pseudomonadota bacterium]